MLNFLLRRLLFMIPVALLVSFVTFMIIHPVTAELGIISLIVSVALAIPLGVLAAGTRNTPIDWLINVLSFLGLGAQPPTPEWGTMVSDAQPYLTGATDPWMILGPALAITITVLCLNLFGDAMRDRLDPRTASKVNAASLTSGAKE